VVCDAGYRHRLIGTTPYMHSAVTISALEAGKHVFCQARMSMDLAEAEEMLAASKRYPELGYDALSAAFRTTRRFDASKNPRRNYIGQPHHVRLAKFPRNYLDPDAPAHWRQKIEISGTQYAYTGEFTLRFCSAGLATLPVCSRAGKSFSHFAKPTTSIVPDLLTVLCSF